MNEVLTPYVEENGEAIYRTLDGVNLFRCPNCDKALAEYTGEIYSLLVICPGCKQRVLISDLNLS